MSAVGIEAAAITKRFGAFTALDEVSLKVRAGSVHALLGENGAGKSTLVKCLLGYHPADGGGFLVDGKEAVIAHPRDAEALGLGMVYQHFTLVPSMTVAENLVMAQPRVAAVIDWKAERGRLAEFIGRMPFEIPLDVPVGILAAGERQKGELLKQLYLERRLLVLDEPTATLTPQESSEVLGYVRALVEAGTLTVIIITHKLKEVAAFADDVSVLRRGKMVGGGKVADLRAEELTRLMIGETHAPATLERVGTPGETARLAIRALTTLGAHGRPGLSRPRQIVGIAGVSGNGQSALLEVLAGQRITTGGTISVAGELYHARRQEAFSRKVRVLPEEPRRNACVGSMTVVDNLNLRRFDRDDRGGRRAWLDRRRMNERARRRIQIFGSRTRASEAPISTRSGGNGQRAGLAR